MSPTPKLKKKELSRLRAKALAKGKKLKFMASLVVALLLMVGMYSSPCPDTAVCVGGGIDHCHTQNVLMERKGVRDGCDNHSTLGNLDDC
jgi:hypothetical protein